MHSLVTCTGLSKHYGDLAALENVNLALPAGKIIGLLGPNGSGKTTLIKLLAGLLQPTAGELLIDGMAIGSKTKAIVSYLPDRMYYENWMLAADLVDFFQDFYADFQRRRAAELCRLLGIDLGERIKTMSKGTQERLQLILAMSREAKLYLLDEPIAGVDPAARDLIIQTILKNYSPNSTVLIATHLIADIEPMLDEVIFLKNGTLIAYDSADHIRSQEGRSIDSLFRDIFRTADNGEMSLC